mgnify:CR=1 FL=1
MSKPTKRISGGDWTKLVYIAGKFRAPSTWDIEQNVRAAEEEALEVWRLGGIAVCPHMNTRFYQGQLPSWVWLKGDLEILRRCDAVLTVPGWRYSEGTQAEVRQAKAWRLPVFHSSASLEPWLRGDVATLPTVEDVVDKPVAAVVEEGPADENS